MVWSVQEADTEIKGKTTDNKEKSINIFKHQSLQKYKKKQADY